MEIAFFVLSFLILIFALLAVFDGLYLHILKYELHRHTESKQEHFTHTLRAAIFPAMVYFLFVVQDSTISFYLGISLVLIDIIVLGIDAYMEKDSRIFMNGLPRWEYILHLFVNGFHFASIFVFLVLKLQITDSGLVITPNFYAFNNFEIFQFIALNLIPGSILIAIIHILLIIPKTAKFWNQIRDKMHCCQLNVTQV
jgi:hypothetical protein